ncbi:hypothetical protein [Nitrosomonas sp. Nm166]|uniref:hypothetical protein n=1 Tax=Nitrosomonas sp. Nm166 TaxID=1881054 RepID=UPI0015A63C20|nr:hypothetical protein [Nitrosomonas sp. Nm166]
MAIVDEAKDRRQFMIIFNRFKRDHDWRYGMAYQDKQKLIETRMQAEEVIEQWRKR